MRPNFQFRYSLKALADLALHQATGPVTVRAIAKRQGIPAPTLEQLFHRLRQKGLVAAERGPRGGYRLSCPPEKITLQQIFELFEPDQKFPTLERDNGSADPARGVWQQVEKAVRTTLQATTLKILAEQVRDQAEASIKHRYTFHI